MTDTWGGAWGTSWGASWGGEAAQIHPIIDTDVIQLPVDYWVARDVPYKASWREKQGDSRVVKTRKRSVASSTVRLSGDGPSFTVTTNKRGYD